MVTIYSENLVIIRYRSTSCAFCIYNKLHYTSQKSTYIFSFAIPIQFIGMKTLIITDIDTECFQDVCDEDGKPKKDSKGNIKQSLKACRVSDGTHTSKHLCTS